MTQISHAPTRKIIPTLLVFGGMLPFVVSTLFVLHFDKLLSVHPSTEAGAAAEVISMRLQFALLSLLAYGAVILSFIGGLRWGVEVAQRPDGPRGLVMILSVMGSLAGWAFVVWGAMVRTSIELFFSYAIVFALLMVWDLGSTSLPRWFKRLRITATVVAAGCFVLSAVLLYWL